MPFWTVEDAGPYKEKSNFLTRTSLSSPFFCFMVKAKAPKPNSPSCDEETILPELPRFLAARPSGLVETSGLEPLTPCMSSKYSNQLSYASVFERNYNIISYLICQDKNLCFVIFCRFFYFYSSKLFLMLAII